MTKEQATGSKKGAVTPVVAKPAGSAPGTTQIQNMRTPPRKGSQKD
jgi:hypothetical protein